MKTTTILLLLVLVAGWCNAQTNNDLNDLQIQTYIVKAKSGEKNYQVNYFDNSDFKRIQKRLDRKCIKKMGETVFNEINQDADYLCVSDDKTGLDQVCLRIYECNKDDDVTGLQFKTNCHKYGASFKTNDFFYRVKDGINYAITLKSEDQNYVFLISQVQKRQIAQAKTN